MSEQNQTSYDVSDEKLVTSLMRASGEAGAATSGLCYDVAAGFRVAYMHYLKGVMLARLAGKKPPYEPGAQVVVSDEQGAREKSFRGPLLQSGHECIVERVWYADNDWYFELKKIVGDIDCPLYRATAFSLAKQ